MIQFDIFIDSNAHTMYIHIYIYIYIHIHTYIHTYIHTSIHAFIFIYTYMHMNDERCLRILYGKDPVSASIEGGSSKLESVV